MVLSVQVYVKDEFVCDCSDLDEIIVFREDGKFMVTKVQDKVFVGKDIHPCRCI